MEYHRRTMELISRWPPTSSPQQIDAAEERLGFNTPVAVRQFYSIENAIELLERYSNSDYPISPVDFSPELALNKSVVEFLRENQGVCSWAFVLDGSDDPAVLINLNPPDQNAWRICVDHFTWFIYCRIFDHIHWYDDLMCGEIYGPLFNDTLTLLRDRFTEEPTTINRAGSPTYRFSQDGRNRKPAITRRWCSCD